MQLEDIQHRTLLNERFRVEGRRTWFETIDEMQKPLDAYIAAYIARLATSVVKRLKMWG